MKIIAKLFLFCLLIISYDGYCQKKNAFAIVLPIENTTKQSEEIKTGTTKTAHPGWNLGIGGAYERLLSKHSSGTIGVIYRKALHDLYIPVPLAVNFTKYAHFLVAENFLTIPIQYEYNFPFASISAGTSLDYFLSWKEQQRDHYAPLQAYNMFFDNKLSFGLIASISKKITLDKNIIFEPSVYYNRVLSIERTYFGGSLEMKYKF